MRVHRLQITAFGPFAGTQEIDFDQLNAAGVFLLTGPTGAGKTSVLDAICFGLFGAVPGARNSAKDLKSHHAADAAAPSVVLEVTIRGRRFRLTRSPGWHRPSRRAASGHVEEKARASIEELLVGGWHAHANRLDEVGQLVSQVLGMSREQFCQVVLLPQGHFQTFLRAGAKDRHDVLESLFETRRFHAIETWLADHRRSREQACARLETELGITVARWLEVAGAGTETDPAAQLSWGDWGTVIEEVGRNATDELVALRGRCSSARVRAKHDQHALDAARQLVDQQARHVEARRHKESLDALADTVTARRGLVQRAREAERFTGLLRLLRDGAADLRRTQAEVADEVKACTVFAHIPPTRDEVLEGAETRRDELAVLRTLLADEAAVEQLCLQREASSRLVAEYDQLISHRRRLAGSLPTSIGQRRCELELAVRAGAEVGPLTGAVEAAEDAHSAAVRAAALVAAADDAATVERRARDVVTQARERWLDIRARYLDGIAAELARLLQAGTACPVCGSTRHPAAAAPLADHATAEDEQRALDSVALAESAAAEALSRVHDVRAALSTARAGASGADVASATGRRDRVRGLLADRQSSAAVVDDVREDLGSLEAELHDVTAELADRLAARTQEFDRGESLAAQVAARRARLVAAVGPAGRVAARVAEVETELRACVAVRDLLDHAATVQAALAALDRQAHERLAESPFTTIDEVESARLPESETAAAEAMNRGYDAEVAHATTLLADPVLVRAASLPAPDVTALEAVAETSAAESSRLTAAAAAGGTRLERLETLAAELRCGVADLRPLAAARDLAAEVAALCAGTSADNATKTKLSHYVLAARLEQVVAAANVRLAVVCGGRYQLVHSMDKGVGDTRGGLGLRVSDTYTGHSRDPATLSGGETFYVSLALALGLADLVGQESGGAELSTLFVDEGFGSLDAETLDEVMDELDALRSGGRCVGVVSHLTELRARIPTQLGIIRSPTGSAVHMS